MMKNNYFFVCKITYTLLLCTFTLFTIQSTAQSPPNGACGTVLNFNGSNDYVATNVQTEITVVTNMTLETWIYIDAYGSSYARSLLSTRNGNNKGMHLSVSGLQADLVTNNEDRRLTFDALTGAGIRSFFSNANLALNTWYHIALTVERLGEDNNTVSMYINGALDKTVTGINDIEESGAGFIIGFEPSANFVPTSYHFDGKMDEVRIWSTTRTAAEISTNMNTSLVGNETGLVAYYNFDDAIGTIASDITANGNNGTLTNMNNLDWTLPNGGIPCDLLPNDVCGTVLNFDGSDDYVVLSSGITPSNNLTISMWIKPAQIVNENVLYSWGPITGCTPSSQRFSILGGKLRSRAGCGTELLGATTLTIGSWYYVALTITNDGYSRLYLNGFLEGEGQTVALATVPGTGNDVLGAGWAGGSSKEKHVEAAIDELKIWSTVKNSAEIAADMITELSGNETNLIAYYKFNDADGAILTDTSINGNDGALMNMDNTDWTLADGSESCSSLSVSSFDEITISLFPNPIKNSFTISGLQEGVDKLQIISLQGQVLKEIKNYKSEIIDIDTLISGIYFVKISSNNTSKTIKIIKEN